MKILLADDSASSRFLLQRALEELGHECVVAGDGLEAWERFAAAGAEVVISDWVMPGIDGDELCRRVRDVPNRPYTYFIMLTSLEDKEHVLHGMQAGVDDYLTKPLDRHELAMRLITAERVTAVHRELLARQQQIENEVEKAAGIQRGLLPESPPAVGGVELAGRCVPAADVGGDYYDFMLDDAGRLVILIADVAGHSIGSALLMAMARSILRREVGAGRSPAEVLAATNSSMFDDLANAGLFITLFCARYDPARHSLEYANAGHNPPLLHRAGGEVEELDADGAAVGILEDVEFEEHTTELAPDDALLFYTDGVVEAGSAAGEAFGEERLKRLVTRNGVAPAQLTEEVFEAVRDHTGGVPQEDDVTLVALRVSG